MCEEFCNPLSVFCMKLVWCFATEFSKLGTFFSGAAYALLTFAHNFIKTE